MIKRIRSIDGSGIWDWHAKVVRKLGLFSSESPAAKPVKATMSGNVSVIFFTLAFGLVIAMASFITECIVNSIRHIAVKRELIGISSALNAMLIDLAHLAVLQTNVLQVGSFNFPNAFLHQTKKCRKDGACSRHRCASKFVKFKILFKVCKRYSYENPYLKGNYVRSTFGLS